MLKQVWAFVLLGRPIFLAGGFLFYHLGVAMALCVGAAMDLSTYLWGQVAVTGTQLMTHYGNEYFDLGADQANRTPTVWAGGSRILPAGRLPRRGALIAALVCGALGLLAMLILSFHLGVGPLALPIMLSAMALSWAYSAPPLRLHSTGTGEIIGAIIVAGLTSLTGYYLVAGGLSALPFLVILPLVCWMFSTLLALSLPDVAGDGAVGKNTLAVRMGPAAATRLYSIALAAGYALLPLMLLAGLPPLVAVLAVLPLPLAAWLIWRSATGQWSEPARWNSLCFWSIAVTMLTAFLMALGFIALAGGYGPGD